MHARDKSISRSGDTRWPEEALLRRTAELTVGYSGAALANLLNEAAILMVTYSAKFACKVSLYVRFRSRSCTAKVRQSSLAMTY